MSALTLVINFVDKTKRSSHGTNLRRKRSRAFSAFFALWLPERIPSWSFTLLFVRALTFAWLKSEKQIIWTPRKGRLHGIPVFRLRGRKETRAIEKKKNGLCKESKMFILTIYLSDAPRYLSVDSDHFTSLSRNQSSHAGSIHNGPSLYIVACF